jgi:hypothetical protein
MIGLDCARPSGNVSIQLAAVIKRIMQAHELKQLKKFGKEACLIAGVCFLISLIWQFGVSQPENLKAQDWSWLLYHEAVLSLGIGCSLAAISYFHNKRKHREPPADVPNP